MKNILFVGYGSMAKKVHEMLPKNINLSAILVKPESVEATKSQVPSSVEVISNINEISQKPDIAVEMAGQQGLKQHAVKILEKGIDLGIISVGAFTDSEFTQNVYDTAKNNNVKVHILAGAIAGIDGLNAASLAGLDRVTYEGIKKPASWKGSYADKLFDSNNVKERYNFFNGSAREAASLFPANSNVAATIALAGVGLDDTKVSLIVDPNIKHNMHRITAEGVFGKLEINMTGLPLEENPKTSSLAAFSVLRLCCQTDDNVLI